jgi:alpha-amylase/alpha-mannosidase (GH57 family)
MCLLLEYQYKVMINNIYATYKLLLVSGGEQFSYLRHLPLSKNFVMRFSFMVLFVCATANWTRETKIPPMMKVNLWKLEV